jgi:hypothetical protein
MARRDRDKHAMPHVWSELVESKELGEPSLSIAEIFRHETFCHAMSSEISRRRPRRCQPTTAILVRKRTSERRLVITRAVHEDVRRDDALCRSADKGQAPGHSSRPPRPRETAATDASTSTVSIGSMRSRSASSCARERVHRRLLGQFRQRNLALFQRSHRARIELRSGTPATFNRSLSAES